LNIKSVLLFVLLIVAVALLFAQSENILLSHISVFKKKQRPPVMFPHAQHMEESECLDCHHMYKDGKNVLDEGTLEEGNPGVLCSACHQHKAKADLQKAFHRQCIGCHKKYHKEGKKTGPRLCAQCHPKK
jgi:c(7)-type cytochrome triheme protein